MVHGEDSWAAHLAGRQHTKNVKAHTYSCAVCACKIVGPHIDWDSHLSSQAHRARVAQSVDGCQRWNLDGTERRQRDLGRELRGAARLSVAPPAESNPGGSRSEQLRAVLTTAAAELGPGLLPAVCNQGNSSGKTALHHAAWAGDSESVELLLAASAHINALTIRGQTALHFAAGKGREQCVEALLAHNGGPAANPDSRRARAAVRTAKGETAAGLAAKFRIDGSLVQALEVRASADGPELDFSRDVVLRGDRRAAMARFGTLVFSSDAQETAIAAGPGKPLPRRRAEIETDDCCALLVCECTKKEDDAVRGPRPGRRRRHRGGSGDGQSATAGPPPPTVEEVTVNWEQFVDQWIEEGGGQTHARDGGGSLDELAAALIELAGGVCRPGKLVESELDVLSSQIGSLLRRLAAAPGSDLNTAIVVVWLSLGSTRRGRGGSKRQGKEQNRAKKLIKQCLAAVITAAESGSINPPRLWHELGGGPSAVELIELLSDHPETVGAAIARLAPALQRLVIMAVTKSATGKELMCYARLIHRVPELSTEPTVTAVAASATRTQSLGALDLIGAEAPAELKAAILATMVQCCAAMSPSTDGAGSRSSSSAAGFTIKWARKLGLHWRVPIPEFGNVLFSQMEDAVLADLVAAGSWASAAEYAHGVPRLELAAAVLAAKHGVDLDPLLDRANGRLGTVRALQQTLQPEFRVVWVDELAGVDALRQACAEPSLVASQGPVALDLEWRDPRQCSLLQLAVGRTVFVVCLLPRESRALENGDDSDGPAEDRLFEALDDVLASVIAGPQPVLGFGMHQDLQRLAHVCPSVLTTGSRLMVDLQKHLVELKAAGAAGPAGSAELSLVEPVLAVAGRSCSALVEVVLGISLSKDEQVSNWDRRPLRPQQLKYAALDAEALLRVWGGIGPELRAKLIGVAEASPIVKPDRVGLETDLETDLKLM